MTPITAINTNPSARGRRASDAHMIIREWQWYGLMTAACVFATAFLIVSAMLYLHVQENAVMEEALAKAKRVDKIPVYKKSCPSLAKSGD